MKLDYLKYYKGEAENPYERGTKEGMFWYLEKMYSDSAEHKKGFIDNWMQEVDSYIARNPDRNDDITSPDKYTKQQKAVILFIDAMLDKWSPNQRDWVFDY